MSIISFMDFKKKILYIFLFCATFSSANAQEGLPIYSAAWLIEKAGFKGKTFGDYGVHKDQALVLVNYKSAKGSDILNLSISIQKAVKLIFDIELEAEVSVI